MKRPYITIIRTILSALFLCSGIAGQANTDGTEFARLRAVADSMHSIGRTDSAIIVANQAAEIAQKSGNTTWILGTHSSLCVF